MRSLIVVTSLLALALLSGCPEERKELIEEVGGAPKRQVDVAKERLDRANDKVNERLEEALKANE